MTSKNIKVKVAAIDAMSATVLLTQFDFDESFISIWGDLSTTIDDRQSFEPTISALGVLRRLFRAKSLADARVPSFASKADEITEFLKKAVQHDYSKVVYEGLRVSSSFLNALRSADTATVGPQYQASVLKLHEIIFEKLGKVNIDTEVKHCCLLTASSLICTAHPLLGVQTLDKYYNIFAERMTSELTREAALKGLAMIASNSLQGDQSGAVIPISRPDNFLQAFFTLLRNQQRQLHLITLECIEALTSRYPSQLAGQAQTI